MLKQSNKTPQVLVWIFSFQYFWSHVTAHICHPKLSLQGVWISFLIDLFCLLFQKPHFVNNMGPGRKKVSHRGTSSNRKEGKSRMIPNWTNDHWLLQKAIRSNEFATLIYINKSLPQHIYLKLWAKTKKQCHKKRTKLCLNNWFFKVVFSVILFVEVKEGQRFKF